MTVLGVLVPYRDGHPGRPEDRPIGRAALRLESEGVAVVFGSTAEDGRLIGFRATPGVYEACRMAVAAAYDRYPSQTDPDGYAALRSGLGDTPVANPMSLTLLCRDKLATHDALVAGGLVVPDVQSDPSQFEETLAAWGAAYLKPRYGAFGRGVSRVTPGDALPAEGEGAVPGVIEPLMLQRGVPPPEGYTGISVRVNAQRTGPDTWHINPPVARHSRDDWVVNAARGAAVAPAADLVPEAVPALEDLTRRVAAILQQQPDGDWLLELGVDAAIDHDGIPHVIEVNSRPRGRLEALAGLDRDAWWEAHVEACARPFRFLAAKVDR